jgi:hypothetical protein
MSRIIRGIKIGCAVLLAVAAVGLFVFGIVAGVSHGKGAFAVVGGLAIAGLPAIIAFCLFWGVFVGDWEAGTRDTGNSGRWWAVLRRRLGSSEALEGARRPEERLPEDVVVEFTTYVGFLIFVKWTNWQFALPPVEARRALWAMLWTNLLCGTFAYGGIFVLPITLICYFQQLRSICRQEKALAAPGCS